MYEQSCTTSDPKRSWSVIIYKIENVTVKKTFAGTDQSTWNRVKLRYFDWPIPDIIRFLVTSITVIYNDDDDDDDDDDDEEEDDDDDDCYK